MLWEFFMIKTLLIGLLLALAVFLLRRRAEEPPPLASSPRPAESGLAENLGRSA